MTVKLLLPDSARQRLRDAAAKILRDYRTPVLRMRELDLFIANLKQEYPDAFSMRSQGASDGRNP